MENFDANLSALYKAAPLYRELFLEQLEFALSPSRFVAAVCSRRAGKTTVCAVKCVQELLDTPNSLGMYLALTDKSVENIFMPIVLPLLDKYGVRYKKKSDEIYFSNGSKLALLGANDRRKIETFRGVKLLFCIIDEAASFSEKILHYLIDQVLTLSLMDLQGQLMLIGTPAAHCKGFFYDVTEKKKQGKWIIKKWNAFSNPHVQENFNKDIEDFLDRKKCDRNSPSFRREYLGHWCTDEESLMIKSPTLTSITDFSLQGWRTVLGVDFGFKDETAFCIIGWRRNNPKAFVLKSYGIVGASVTEISNELHKIKDRYNPCRIVGDPAGASKIIMKEFCDKHKIYMEVAQKSNKAHYVEILNDAVINDNLVFDVSFTGELVEEIDKCVWNEERTRELEGVKCDQIDAMLYAYRESLAFTEKIKEQILVDPRAQEKWMLQETIRDVERQNNYYNDDPHLQDISEFLR